MPLLFIPASVGLIDSWGVLRGMLLPVATITVVSTVVVMAVTGRFTQWIIRRDCADREEKSHA
jgi:holin-like protein